MWMHGVPSPWFIALLPLPPPPNLCGILPSLPKSNHTHIEKQTNRTLKTASLTCLSPRGGQGLFGINILLLDWGVSPDEPQSPRNTPREPRMWGLCPCEISASFHRDHNLPVPPRIQQHNNKDNRRPTSSPNKDVIQLPPHTC